MPTKIKDHPYDSPFFEAKKVENHLDKAGYRKLLNSI
jgi:hypothetical protein